MLLACIFREYKHAETGWRSCFATAGKSPHLARELGGSSVPCARAYQTFHTLCNRHWRLFFLNPGQDTGRANLTRNRATSAYIQAFRW